MSEEKYFDGADGVKRRTIIQGAAWSVPAVALMVAAPAAAGSVVVPCTPGTETVRAITSKPTTATKAEQTWTIPAGVTRIRFEIIGGGGGGALGPAGSTGWTATDRARYGGSGAKVGGYLEVKTGDVIRIVAGAGGLMNQGKTTVAGGQGWGNGGDSTGWTSGADGRTTSSGGGGSAILVNGEVMAIAGGGGGSSGSYGGADPYWPSYSVAYGKGGDAGLIGASAANGGTYTFEGNFPTSTVSIPGGGGGTQTQGGQPGPLATWEGTPWTEQDSNSGGVAGGDPSLAGADGGDGPWTGQVRGSMGDYLGTAGGGGGYSGGASGSYTASGHYASGHTSQFIFSGGGGGGTSYVSPLVLQPSSSLANNGATTQTRQGGQSTVFAC